MYVARNYLAVVNIFHIFYIFHFKHSGPMSVHRFWYKGNFDVIYFWCWWWFPRSGIKLTLSHLTETEVIKAPVIWSAGIPATVLGFWPRHSIFMQVNYLVCGAKMYGQFPCTLYKATFLAARSDQNVCKITMWCVNENADHRVPAPCIPWSGWKRPWF